MKSQKGMNIIWGAGSKGVIFAFHTQRLGCMANFVIDINPVKQGKYIPVTGLPILSPQSINQLTRDDVIFILNLNYYDEIKNLVGENAMCYCGESR